MLCAATVLVAQVIVGKLAVAFLDVDVCFYELLILIYSTQKQRNTVIVILHQVA